VIQSLLLGLLLLNSPVSPVEADDAASVPKVKLTTAAEAADARVMAEPQVPVSEPPDLAKEELNLGWTLVRTLLVLAIVVGLAWLTLNVGLRRLLGIRAASGTSMVSVLERVMLDQKRTLFVVEAAGEVMLIGGGDSHLSLIAKLDSAEVARLKAEAAPNGTVQLSPFLKKLLGRKSPTPPAP
jgi:flagellar protein FliO/FliZ